MAQDLGSEFQFSSDKDALHSILNNRGVSYSQTLVVGQQSRPSVTPAKVIPNNFKKTDHLEFFESKGGQIFFRKKVMDNRKGHTPNKNLISGIKGGFGKSFREIEGDYGLPKRMNFSSNKKLRYPLNSVNVNSIDNKAPVAPVSQTVKKSSVFVPPIHRQSISEKKQVPPVSGLPVPKQTANVRKMLFTQPKPVPSHLKPKPANDHQFISPDILPSLTKLTRESFRLLPRESLAWMSQLPRESATFAELEKLMTDDDRNNINEDDTGSFEALEKRLRTPLRMKPVVVISRPQLENKENLPSQNTKHIKQSTAAPSEGLVVHDAGKTPKPRVDKVDQSSRAAGVNKNNSSEGLDSSCDKSSITYIEPISRPSKSAPSILCDPQCKDVENKLTPALKSLSTTDLPSATEVEVSRCASVADITDVVSISDLVSAEKVDGLLENLSEYQEQLCKFKEAQDDLAKQEALLLDKIKSRKEQFKQVWGVSPLKINTIRTILTQKYPTSSVLQTPKTSGSNPLATLDLPLHNSVQPDTIKRVRFDSDNNESRNISPSCTDEFSPLCSPLGSLSNSTAKCSSANQSYANLKSSLGFLQTPLPPKKTLADINIHSKAQSANQLVEPTPVALKKLSDRVKAEFDALYADSSDDADTDTPGTYQAKLRF